MFAFVLLHSHYNPIFIISMTMLHVLVIFNIVFIHRTIDSLYSELVHEGIIVRPNKVSISDYIGEYSYLGTTLRQANIEPMPSLSDVRRIITEFCILPLGTHALFFTLHLLVLFITVEKLASSLVNWYMPRELSRPPIFFLGFPL